MKTERMRCMAYDVRQMQSYANNVLENHNIRSLPVDIISLVKKDGIKIFKMIFDDDTSGALLVDKFNTIAKTGANKVILVENKADECRGRYITAHEYAHYLLHKKDEQVQFAHRDYSHSNDEAEVEADLFARSILMPYDLIVSELNKSEKMRELDVVKYISEMCNVTLKKAAVRFKELINEDILSYDKSGFVVVKE